MSVEIDVPKIRGVEDQIAEVASCIQNVQQKIFEIGATIVSSQDILEQENIPTEKREIRIMILRSLIDEKKALMDEKKALMDKEKALMDEKKALMDEKKALMEKEMAAMPASSSLVVLSKAFREAKKNNLNSNEAVIHFPANSLGGRMRYEHIFVRDFYDRFIEEKLGNLVYVKNLNEGAAVMGTPGIGKSAFAWYVVWKALQMGKIVVYNRHDSHGYVLFQGDAPVQLFKEFPTEYDDINTVLVLDSVKPFFTSSCYTLLVSSPDYEIVKDFLKWTGVASHEYFFPTLDFDELKLMRDSCFGGKSTEGVDLLDEELERRFLDLFGGVPRFIFSDDATFGSDYVVGKMVNKALDHLRTGSVTRENVYQLSHNVFHLKVSRKTFEVEEIVLASNKASTLLSKYDTFGKHRAMDAFLKIATGNSIFGALHGQVFEAMVRRELPSRKFLDTKTMNGEEGVRVLLPNNVSMSPKIFRKASEICVELDSQVRIWAPKSSKQPAVDFIVTRNTEVFFFNATISASHGIVLKTEASTGLMDIAKTLHLNGYRVGGKEGISFCWLLPENVFTSFSGFGSKKIKAEDEKLIKDDPIIEYKVVIAPPEKFFDGDTRD
jgi:hypothetical protein